MERSPAYVLGVLDTLVKAGEVSPSYAAGVASVLQKEAGLFSDSAGVNLTQQWDDFVAKNRGAYNPQTGQATMTGAQAKGMIDSARPWYDNMGGRAMANLRHWGRSATSWLPEWVAGRRMSVEESRRLLEHDRNKFRQDYLARANGAGPSALYAAFQDNATRDAKYARRDQTRYMHPGQLEAEFGENDEAAAAKFRSPQGMAAMRGGLYKPTYDTRSAKTPKPSIHNNPLSGMYGSAERQKLYSQPFRGGLGKY